MNIPNPHRLPIGPNADRETGYMGDTVAEVPAAAIAIMARPKTTERQLFEARAKKVRMLGRTVNFCDDLLRAYQNVGGVFWLTKFAYSHPEEFARLLARMLPVQVAHSFAQDEAAPDLSQLSNDELNTLASIRAKLDAIAGPPANTNSA